MKCCLGDRLSVIPEGISEDFFLTGKNSLAEDRSGAPPLPNAIAEGTPYFLWSGSLNPRKNLIRVIEALEQVASEIPHHLVLSGSLGWDLGETLRRIRSSPVAERIHLPGHVSDQALRGLYQGATAFVYVSLMEGFGLPILEAMASGCPVITSNISSMPEVAGDAAFLVNPLDTTEIANAMHCLATDFTFSKHLSSRGRARAEEFHWDACAGDVAEIYRRVAPSSDKFQRFRAHLPSDSESQKEDLDRILESHPK